MSAPISSKIGENGRIVIPVEMRRQLGLKDGDVVQISVEDHQVVITPRSLLLRQLFDATTALRDSPADPVQELIDERKAEAAQE
jgi:AbrB family looped-hinge helix DNA binding protein